MKICSFNSEVLTHLPVFRFVFSVRFSTHIVRNTAGLSLVSDKGLLAWELLRIWHKTVSFMFQLGPVVGRSLSTKINSPAAETEIIVAVELKSASVQ